MAAAQNFTAEPDAAAGVLRITVHKDQDPMVMAREWPRGVIAAHPGPWNQVVIDLSYATAFQSSFIAGLMILNKTWSKGAGRRIVLRKPPELLLRSLRTLNIDGMFVVEP